MKWVKITEVRYNDKNPRVIRDDKFAKLKRSIIEFPEMLEKRPLVCVTRDDGKLMVLGGNMRLKALNDIGAAEVPVILADDWSEEQRARFLIKDNVGFGEWDWDALANEWDADKLEAWGLNMPEFANPVDYSILDGEDLNGTLADMAGGVKKAIQIEFEPDDYEEAYALVKFWRERGAYVGALIIEHLSNEKTKL